MPFDAGKLCVTMATESGVLPERYVNVERIASGGMGEIFLAEDETLGRKVAIKVLAERYARDEGVRRRFTREALTAARLSGHPHVVTIFDVGEEGERPFIVMEYLAGGTLADRARRGRVSREEAIEWLEQAAEALDDAHANGIVHRDVKPANMLLDERGVVHVGDFGIARVLDETTTGMTMAGTILGTAGYLSPEQARGEPATAASDVYGLAIVAYELLTGGRPFEGGSATAEAAAHIHQPVPPASQRGVGLPPEIDPVFGRALAKEPERRHGSAKEFVQALCRALEARETTRVLPGAPVPPAQARTVGRRRSPLFPILVGLGLAAAVIAGVVVAATMGGDDGDRAGAGPTATTKSQAPATQEVTVTETLPGTTVKQTATVTTPVNPPPPPPSAETTGSVSLSTARQLTDQATAALRGGDWEGAYALAERALGSLRGTGDIYEAYAYYNAGRALASLGQCPKALDYINRSEAIQGSRSQFAEVRSMCS